MIGQRGLGPQPARPRAPHAPPALLLGVRATVVRHPHRRHDEVHIHFHFIHEIRN